MGGHTVAGLPVRSAAAPHVRIRSSSLFIKEGIKKYNNIYYITRNLVTSLRIILDKVEMMTGKCTLTDTTLQCLFPVIIFLLVRAGASSELERRKEGRKEGKEGKGGGERGDQGSFSQ